jgi:tetratricopeptide (TPR) repeat protein
MKLKIIFLMALLACAPFAALFGADVAQLRRQIDAENKPRKAYPLWLTLGSALSTINDYAGAIEAYKNAVKLQPKVEEGRLLLAGAYERAQLYGQAVVEYKSALERNPKSYIALVRLAALYLKDGFTSKAMECYINALTLHPDSETYRQTARCAEDMGNLKLAESMLRQALSSENIYDDNLNLGRVLMLAGDHHESEKYLSEAVKINPAMSDAYLQLGLLYEKMNDYVLAEKMLQIAQEKAPNEGVIHFFLAQLYYHQNNRPKALSEITLARAHAKTPMLAAYSAKFQSLLEEYRGK